MWSVAGWMILILTAAGPIVAQPSAAPPDDGVPLASSSPAVHPNQWYGWQIIGADALALGLGVAVSLSQDGDSERRLGQASATMWSVGTLTSMTIHGLHHRPQLGFGASATRLVVPPLATVLGMGGVCLAQRKRGCAGDGAAWGFAAGVTAAAAADAMIFSRIDSRSETRDFYGTPTLIIDGLGFGLSGLLVAMKPNDADGQPLSIREKAIIIGGLHYFVSMFGAPWVHVRHGNGGRALGSFGIRLLTPVVGSLFGVTGYCAATAATNDCAKTGAAFGFLGGTAFAAIVDIAWLSSHELQGRPSGGTRVAPYAVPVEGGLTFGIVASN